MTKKPTYEELEQRIKDLEQAEIKLKRSEELFRGLFDNMTSGSAIYEVVNDGLKGSDYIVKGFNNKSLEIEGKTLEDVLGKTLFDLRPSIDDYGLIPVMKKVWETGLSYYYPVTLYKDNNFSSYYENYIFKISSGEIVTIYNDITIQKNQELALQESKERFELAMQFTNDGLFDWNLETNQIHYSSGWKKMLGYRDDEIKDEFSEWERLTKFEDMKASWDMLNEVLEGKRDHFEKESKMQHKDGHWVDILSRANVVFNEDGKGVRVVGTHVDITKRKEIEQSLYESEARFKALHNASFGGIAIHDKGVILDCNQGLSEITGYSMTELTEMDGLLLMAEKSRHFVMQNILSGYEKPYEAVGLRKNGEEYPMRLEGRNIPYKGKDVRVVEFRDITEQKRIEEELRVSVIKHKTILEALPVGVTVSDDAENIVESNKAAQKMLGLSREEHLKRKIQGNEWSIIREDGSPMPSDEFASVRALKEGCLVENVVMGIVKEYNEVTWISVSSTPVPLEGYGVAISFIDITERKRTEGKYLTLFSEMLDGFALHEIICDENGKPIDYKFLTVNPAFERMTGLKAVDIADKRVLEVLPDIEKYWIEIYGKVAITGEPTLFENYSNELKKHFEVKAFRPAYGQFACIIADITERKHIEAELRLTHFSINNIADSIFWIDKSAKFLFVNDAACKNLGYSREELLTMNICDVDPVFHKEILEEHWEKISKPNAVVIVDTIHQTKDGKQFPVEVTNKLLEFVGKQYNVAVVRDITARKQAELKQRELEAANLRLQKADSLSKMAGGIAHLFNNYLYAVSGNLELALEYLSNDSSIHKYLTEAMKSARKCADVSGSMLHYLGQNFAQTQSLDMSECCRKILSDFQSQSSANSGITIETELMDAELLVRANTGQMQQVLNHIITNAIESIGENKGRINLTTKTIPSTDISKFHLLPVDGKPSAKTYACVEVTDTGCGISKEDIHKISDPFFTTKFTGRGLGLAVVSGIVKSWGGCIGVRSKVGHGSTFMVFIPLSDDNSIRQSKRLAQSLQPQQKELSTVLIVDDNAAVLKITTIMLKKMGFEVISAVNGVEAVEKFRQHKESINCLITDLSMPELDGWGTLATIRKIKPDIPAVLASGYDEAFAMSSDDSEKPQAFLHKPYTMADLKSVLEQAINF